MPEAIYLCPPPSGNRIVDALLAAIAEKLADDAALPRPSWTRAIPPLDAPYRPKVARSNASHEVPPQLEARGIFIDTASLWRNRASIGI